MAFFRKRKKLEIREPEEFEIKIKLTNKGGCYLKEISINGGVTEVVRNITNLLCI